MTSTAIHFALHHFVAALIGFVVVAVLWTIVRVLAVMAATGGLGYAGWRAWGH